MRKDCININNPSFDKLVVQIFSTLYQVGSSTVDINKARLDISVRAITGELQDFADSENLKEEVENYFKNNRVNNKVLAVSEEDINTYINKTTENRSNSVFILPKPISDKIIDKKFSVAELPVLSPSSEISEADIITYTKHHIDSLIENITRINKHVVFPENIAEYFSHIPELQNYVGMRMEELKSSTFAIGNDRRFVITPESRKDYLIIEASTKGDDFGRKLSAFNASLNSSLDGEGNKIDAVYFSWMENPVFNKGTKPISIEEFFQRIKESKKGEAPKNPALVEATNKYVESMRKVLGEKFTEKQEKYYQEEFTFYEVYLPIWESWWRRTKKTQFGKNLIEMARGSKLAFNDYFASFPNSSRVNQARALAIILNRESIGKRVSISPITSEFIVSTSSTYNSSSEVVNIDSALLDFTAIELKDTTQAIVSAFSQTVKKAIEKRKAEIDSKLNDTSFKTPFEKDALIAEKAELEGQFATASLLRTPEYSPSSITHLIYKDLQNRRKTLFNEGQITESKEFKRILNSLLKKKEKSGSTKTSEELEASLKQRFESNISNLDKTIEHFPFLMETARPYIESKLSIAFTGEKDKESLEEESEVEEDNGEESEIKGINYLKDFRNEKSEDNLSARIKEFIAEIPRLNSEGKQEKDILGFTKYLDPAYVFVSLIEVLRPMTRPSEMIPLLEKEAKNKKWMSPIVKALKEDHRLRAAFYHRLNLDFTNYWIQRKDFATNTVKSIRLNRRETIFNALEEWSDNIISGNILHPSLSIYNSNNTLNINNIKHVKEKANELQKKVDNFKVTEIKELRGLLGAVGISINLEYLKNLLTIEEEGEGRKIISEILNNLVSLANTITKPGVLKGRTVNGEFIFRDIVSDLSTIYGNIAKHIAEVTPTQTEGSARNNDKTYYSHTIPNFLSKTISRLSNQIELKEKEYKQYLMSEYASSPFYNSREKRFLNDLLNTLYSNPSLAKEVSHKVVLERNGQDIVKLVDIEYFKMIFDEYNSDNSDEWAYYPIPVLSDSSSYEFLRLPKYSTRKYINNTSFKSVIAEKVYNMVESEILRMESIKDRYNRRKNGEVIPFIPLYDIKENSKGEIEHWGGLEFRYAPFLNGHLINNTPLIEIIRRGNQEEIVNALSQISSEVIEKYLDKVVEEELYYLEDIGFFKEEGRTTEDVKTERKGELTAFILDNYLANLTIQQLLLVDPVYYKNTDDIIKRIKQVHTPAMRLNTDIEIDGKPAPKTYRALYLTDEFQESEGIQEIKEILTNSGRSKIEVDFITSKLSNNNVTDGQSYPSMETYRKRAIMSDNWTERHENAYNNFMTGNWTLEDFHTIWSILKPFAYSMVNIDSKRNDSGFLLPVQHKNSEFPLMAIYDLISGGLSSQNKKVMQNNVLAASPKLRAMAKVMSQGNIDVIHYESVVKVGVYNTVSLAGLTTEEEITSVLQQAINNNWLHTMKYDDYGIIFNIDEHHLDSKTLIGTQFRRIITANLPIGSKYKVGGNYLSREEVIELFEEVQIENIKQSWKELNKKFKNPYTLSKFLEEEIYKSPIYDADLLKAIKLNENGEFGAGLFDPILAPQLHSLINSIIRNKVVKQKINGAQLTLVSNVGLTDDLSIRYKIIYQDKSKKEVEEILPTFKEFIQENPNSNKEEYEEYKKTRVTQLKGTLSLAYIEAYMPIYSKELLPAVIDPKTGAVDVNRLPEELRKSVGYRIPTEAKYSMLPIRIKDFLPLSAGSAIMLPSDVTTLSGSDFDSDKLFMMFKPFKIEKYSIDGVPLKELFREQNKALDPIGKGIGNLEDFLHDYNIIDEDTSVGERNIAELDLYASYKEWEKEYESQHEVNIFATPFSPYLGKKKNNRKLNKLKNRNTTIVDIAFEILTNPEVSNQVFKPGQFDTIKKTARINEIVNSGKTVNEIGSEVSLLLNDEQKKVFRKEYEDNGMSEALLLLDLKSLFKVAEKIKPQYNLATPSGLVHYHVMTANGSILIGVFANQTANHALVQNRIDMRSAKSFMFNGKEYSIISPMMVKETIKDINGNIEEVDKFTSERNEEFSAASVDNVKDTALASLNQSTFTANVTSLLIRMGLDIPITGFFMNTPILRELDRQVGLGRTTGDNATSIIKKIKGSLYYQYKELTGEDIRFKDFVTKLITENPEGNITTKELSEYTLGYYNEKKLRAKKIPISPEYTINKIKLEFKILETFQDLLQVSDELSSFILNTKQDGDKGSTSKDVVGNIVKQYKVEKMMKNLEKEGGSLIISFKRLNGDPSLNTSLFPKMNQGIEYDTETFLSYPLPVLTAMKHYSIDYAQHIFSKLTPYASNSFKNAIFGFSEGGEFIPGLLQHLKGEYLDEYTLNKFVKESYAYFLSGMPELSKMAQAEEGKKSSVAHYYIHDFPLEFDRLKRESEEFRSIPLVSKLIKINPNNEVPIPYIKFQNTGRLNPKTKVEFKRDWLMMVISDNPKIREMAKKLIIYNYFTSGLSFTPNSFTNLSPVELRFALKDYEKTLMTFIEDTKDDDFFLLDYLDQFLLNNLHNPKIAPILKKELRGPFFKEGKSLEELTLIMDIYKDTEVLKKKSDGIFGGLMKYITVLDSEGVPYHYEIKGYNINPNKKNLIAVEFKKVNPLGLKNRFLEYSSSTSSSELRSVINREELKEVLKEVKETEYKESPVPLVPLKHKVEESEKEEVMKKDNICFIASIKI